MAPSKMQTGHFLCGSLELVLFLPAQVLAGQGKGSGRLWPKPLTFRVETPGPGCLAGKDAAVRPEVLVPPVPSLSPSGAGAALPGCRRARVTLGGPRRFSVRIVLLLKIQNARPLGRLVSGLCLVLGKQGRFRRSLLSSPERPYLRSGRWARSPPLSAPRVLPARRPRRGLSVWDGRGDTRGDTVTGRAGI